MLSQPRELPPLPTLPPLVQDGPMPIPPPDDFVLLLQSLPPQVVVLIIAGMLGVTAFILAPVARAIARRIEGTGAKALHEELDQLRHRLAELEDTQGRLAELEERLDFNERMLAQAQRVGPLPGGEERRG